MENVSGLVKGKMKLIFADIMRELKASGYKVSCRLLNAMYFQVPQSRQRMIFVGMRSDLESEPSHPQAKAKPITFTEATRDAWVEACDLPFNAETETARVMRRARAGEQDPKHFSTFKLWADRPANTLRKDFLGYFHYWHPAYFRPLNLIEWKRLGSFPDAYLLTEKKSGCQQIGNSVPPLFMQAIAEHVRTLVD
jgi:DNA (cytosine-5)-methyltransferase 1